MNSTVRRLIPLLIAVMLQACAATDPQLNTEDWHPTGANAHNLAAEVANPADLFHGQQATDGAEGDLAAAAVNRLRTGHVKPLPDSGVTDLQVKSSNSTNGS